MLEIESENSIVTEEEKKYWIKPENLKDLVARWKDEMQRIYMNVSRLSFNGLVAILIAVSGALFIPFLKNYQSIILKSLGVVCGFVIPVLGYLYYNWTFEMASKKYTNKLLLILLTRGAIMYLLFLVAGTTFSI